MRVWLIQALTGRRANEILKLSFRPYTLLPGVDLELAGEDDFVARLTYAQTKVDGVDPTILVERAVVNIIHEQQRWLLELLAESGMDDEPEYLFVQAVRNRRARLPRSLGSYGRAMRDLDRTLQLTDEAGQPLLYAKTHRLRHTKATALLNHGVPVHVAQRYMGHLSPEMTMRYGVTLAKTAEAEFLRYKKIGRDGRDIPLSPRDLYELAELDRRTDRILPNGLCMLPPTKKCERGNACLPCDFFATDSTHLDELRRQQNSTLTLITQRKCQHLERTGSEMTDDNIWLQGRMTELRSIGAIINRLEAEDIAQVPEPIAVRGAGVSGRPGHQAEVTPEVTPDAVHRGLQQRHVQAEDGAQ
jgi:Phage integrase family